MSKLVVDIVTTGLLRVNNTPGNSGYIMLNGRVISELRIEKGCQTKRWRRNLRQYLGIRLEGLQKNTMKLEWSLSLPNSTR